MPEITISYPAIVMAVINQFLLALVWYGVIFRYRWSREIGVNPDVRPSKKYIGRGFALMFVSVTLMAWVLAHNMAVWNPATWGREPGDQDLLLAVSAGFFTWLGFVAPVLLAAVAWGRKSWAYFALNGAYYLLGLIIMAITIMFFKL